MFSWIPSGRGGWTVRLVARRVLALIPVLLLVLFLVMLLVDLQGGSIGQSVAGEFASPEAVAATTSRLNLDDPLFERFFSYLASAVHGDLGASWVTERPVGNTLVDALPVTLSLTLFGLAIALVLALPLGIVAALTRGRFLDRTITFTSSVSIAVPEFVSGLVLVVIFALRLSWLPATGYVPFGEDPLRWAEHLLLPGLALGIGLTGHLARQVRAAMIDTLDQDFIRTGRAMGLRRRSIVGKHAGRNAASPVLTVLGLQAAHLLGGAVIVERVFALPGYGSVAVEAVLRRDVPVVQGAVLLTAVLVLLINLIVDISYGYFNPKLRA